MQGPCRVCRVQGSWFKVLILCTTVFEDLRTVSDWPSIVKIAKMCTGANALHKFGQNMCLSDKRFLFDDTSRTLLPDFPDGREQEDS